MAVSCASASLLFLLAISSLDWLSPASAFLTDWDHMTSGTWSAHRNIRIIREDGVYVQRCMNWGMTWEMSEWNLCAKLVTAPLGPHITECISRDQETFRCWWSPGTFQNLSSPGALRLFYIKSPMTKWKECPEYIDENRECFFDANHTSIWKPYCMQLRSQDNTTFFSEDDCFTVENIVRPDPPVSLNWTLLNVSPSGLSYDVMVSWEPPPSADVERGWMRIEYELQYRERNATNWEALEVQPNTQQTIYGLQIGKEFELHIRCRMKAFTKFGDFSESIFIQATEIPSQGPAVLLTLVLIFGIVGIFILILLIVLSQQQRLMMILLPPVPAPKIKGIDSEMLKKGKLEELNFILSGGGIGGLPPYSDAFYQDEPWVEFIEVDEEDADVREDSQGSDTERLLALPQSVSHRTVGSSNSISQPGDDSDQPSCYAADLHERDNQIWMGSLLPGQPEDGDPSLNAAEQAPASERGDRPLIQTQTGVPQTWVNTDFYAQVSNVMPSGGVVLSPGQQLRAQDGSTSEKESQKKGKQSEEGEENEDRKPREPQFQLLVVDAEGSGYTTESNARQIGTPLDAPMPGEGYQTIQPTQSKPAATTDASQSPYILPDSPPPQFLAPVADYTVVQELDTHHSLLLNPPPRQSPPPCLPQHPLKAPMPIEYVTPDLLGNFSP